MDPPLPRDPSCSIAWAHAMPHSTHLQVLAEKKKGLVQELNTYIAFRKSMGAQLQVSKMQDNASLVAYQGLVRLEVQKERRCMKKSFLR